MTAATHDPTAGPEHTLERLLDARHSCRGFRPEALDDAVIRRIVELARKTASWCNTQPWQVVITRGAATERFRDAMFEHAGPIPAHARPGAVPPEPDFPFPQSYPGVLQERRRACGFQLYDSVGIERGDKLAYFAQARENFRFFGAPHVAIVTTPAALGVYGAIDCGAFVGNFTLAATALGVASIAQAALASDAEFLRRFFHLPADRQIVCGISFGYEDTAHPANGFRTTRAAVDDVVTWAD